MWAAIGNFLLSLVKSALLWMVAFVVGSAALMLLIMGIVKIAAKIKKARHEPPFQQAPFEETSEYINHICLLLRLLSDDDKRLVAALPLFARDKVAFAKQYVPDLNIDSDEDCDYWPMMFHTLGFFGYLSYNDWKLTVADALNNLASVLEHYGISPAIFDDIPDKDSMVSPEVWPLIAARLPQGYALLDVDTGEDSYAFTIAPVSVAREVVAISDAMEKPPYLAGIKIMEA